MKTEVIMTESRAKDLGYRVTRGAYSGTTDDRIDRWYIDDIESDIVDRRGFGYATKQDALEAIGDRQAELKGGR